MKKIHLNIDLEDNELLKKSVEGAVVSYARQISREQIDLALTHEIDRITTARVNELKNSSYYNSILNRIADMVVKKITKENFLNNDHIAEMIDHSIQQYFDTKIQGSNSIERYVEKYMDKSIANALLQKSKENQLS